MLNLTFSFCLKPLSVENIVTIKLVIEDHSLSIKQALEKAIKEFNVVSKFFKIKQDPIFYQLKISKKNGLPKSDLPSKD